MSFYFYSSNDLNHLVDLLGNAIKTSLPNPLKSKLILTENKTTTSWLSFKLASKNGIFANALFKFPMTFFKDLSFLLEEVMTKNEFWFLDNEMPCDSIYLRWVIMKVLHKKSSLKEFPILKEYLQKDTHKRKLFSLSRKLSLVYEQYLTYRFDWLLKWEREKISTHWQGALWKEIVKSLKILHKANLREKVLNVLKEKPLEKMPECLFVFGISNLSPFFTEILKYLSRHINVYLYFFSPFYDDSKNKEPTKENPWFVSTLDKQLKDSYNLFKENSDFKKHFYFPPVKKTLLNIFKQYVMEGKKPIESKTVKQCFLKGEENSLQIHVCSSLMREVEVLYQNLCSLFSEGKYSPSDVLVVSAEMDKYAPYVEAVFQVVEQETPFIPYRILDQNLMKESSLMKDFFKPFRFN